MIIKAIKRAYSLKSEKYSYVYWSIDLHGVCFTSNYKTDEYQWINDTCHEALRLISSDPCSRIILWSSCFPREFPNIIKFFESYGIRVDYFNENPLMKNTEYGCFDKKFYFSVLIDDKAGFDPETDWQVVKDYMTEQLIKDSVKFFVPKKETDDVKERIRDLIKDLPKMPPVPSWPKVIPNFPPYSPNVPIGPIGPGILPLYPKPYNCSVCGINLTSPIGYCCPRTDCPTGLGPIIC